MESRLDSSTIPQKVKELYKIVVIIHFNFESFLVFISHLTIVEV